MTALEVGDREQIETDADGNAIPKALDETDTGAGGVKAAADADNKRGFCIMQLYHGELAPRSVYARMVKGHESEAAKYEVELEGNGIESSANGFVYLFRDPDLTEHTYNTEEHAYIWNVASAPTNSSAQKSVTVRTRRLLGPVDAGRHSEL